MAGAKQRVVTVRMVLVSVVVGVVLAVASVPVGTVLREVNGRWRLATRLPGEQHAFGVFPAEYLNPPRTGTTRFAAAAQKYPLFHETAMVGGERYTTLDPGEVPRAVVQAAIAGEWVDVFVGGYPFRAAIGWWHVGTPGNEFWLLGWDKGGGPIGRQPVAIPLRPIWPGLLANTLFYAALTLALLAGSRWLHTRRRRKRGRCVACGYELGEGVGVCPECGLAA